MSLFHVFILGTLEGITEFLPISSTGHMILASKLLGINQTAFVKSFEIIIQLGAITAIAVLYGKTLLKIKSLWLKLITAFIPTAIIGFLLYKFVKQFLLGNTTVTVGALFIGGIAFIILEYLLRKQKQHTVTLDHVSVTQTIFIGLTQSISIVPGVSRAAATMFGGMVIGLDRQTAVEFSFLLAVPTMLAASALDLIKSGWTFTTNEYGLLTIGFITAFITAIIAVNAFVRFMQNHTFLPFGLYRIILALIFFLFVK